MLKRYLDLLINELGWDPIAPNEDGTYSALLDPDLQIGLKENDPSGINLKAQIAPLPQKKREEYLLKMMEANLFGAETGGCVLGLDTEGTSIMLLAHLSPNASYKEFRDCFEDFANYAESWREETKKFSEVSEADAT